METFRFSNQATDKRGQGRTKVDTSDRKWYKQSLRYILDNHLDKSNIPDLFLSIDNLKLSIPILFVGTIDREKLKTDFHQNTKEIKLGNDNERINGMQEKLSQFELEV